MGFCFKPRYSTSAHLNNHINRIEGKNMNIRRVTVKRRRLLLSNKDYKFLQSIGFHIRY